MTLRPFWGGGDSVIANVRIITLISEYSQSKPAFSPIWYRSPVAAGLGRWWSSSDSTENGGFGGESDVFRPEQVRNGGFGGESDVFRPGQVKNGGFGGESDVFRPGQVRNGGFGGESDGFRPGQVRNAPGWTGTRGARVCGRGYLPRGGCGELCVGLSSPRSRITAGLRAVAERIQWWSYGRWEREGLDLRRGCIYATAPAHGGPDRGSTVVGGVEVCGGESITSPPPRTVVRVGGVTWVEMWRGESWQQIAKP